jgi:SAM-dependent methyltransferase
MYDEFAHLWPLISAPEDYAYEASFWRKALRGKLGRGKRKILELGAGGGSNLSHLTDDFEVTAVDISPKMLEVSRRLNPDVEHLVGDMRKIRLRRKFAAVIIHDAICYMKSEEDLRSTFRTVSAHLDRGGVFITSPDYTRETFVDDYCRYSTRSDDRVRLTFIHYQYDPDPGDSTYEVIFTFLIWENGRLRIEHDRHVFGLFSWARWLELMDEAGFATEKKPYDVHDDGRESYLLVGVKR